MIDVILKLGALQAFILSVVLFFRKENGKANRVLALLVLLLGLMCMIQSVRSVDFYLENPHLIRLDIGIPLLFGPILLRYVKLLTQQSDGFRGKEIWHYFPYLLHLIFLAPFLIQSGERKIQSLDYFTARVSTGSDFNLLMVAAMALVGIYFGAKALRAIRSYHVRIRSEYSELQRHQLDWLYVLILMFTIMFGVLAVVFVLFVKDTYAREDYSDYFYLVSSINVYLIAYYTLKQPQLVAAPLATESTKAERTPAYNSQQAEKLSALMEFEKPYLKNDLTASELAAMLDISRHELSELLSHSFHQNFYEFVNAFRVEEFKRRLNSSSNQHLTLLAIAFEAGFNSKTAFNTAFKNKEGITPSQFKANLKK